MRASSVLGIVLIAIGALTLAYPGITFTERDHVVDMGPLQVTTEHQESIPIPPLIAGLAVAAGVGVLLATRR